MNWRRGLFRLWVCLSIIWICFWAWQRNIVCELNLPHYGSGPWCEYQTWDVAFHIKTAAILFGPPLLVGLVGWVISGFGRTGQKPSQDTTVK